MDATMVFPGLLRAVRVSICGTLLMAVLLPASTSAESKSQNPALELQTLEDFLVAEQMVARKPVTEVDEGYRSKLEKHQKTAQAAGDLKGVIAAKQAIADLDAGRPPVSDDPNVAAIQKAYITQRQKADAEAEKANAKANENHLVTLKSLVVRLTKSGDLEQAQAAQAKVDEFTETLNPKAASQLAPGSGQEVEEWKKRAQAEFPALKDPASPLSKRLKALMAEKKADSGYFINPQWPYLLAREAEQTLPPEEAKLLDKAPEVLPLKKQLAGKWNLKSNTGRRTTITFKEDGTFVEAQMGVDIANGEWKKIGNSLKVKKKDWTDVYELPIQDGKLKGRSQQGNFLDLSKLPDQ